MSDATFRGDCGRCAGLCCVLLAFDRGPNFAFDKPAGVACRHLTASHRCQVHAQLGACGLAGCQSFDCRGAGQLVTAMFDGIDWRSTAAGRRAVEWAFAVVRDIQAMRLLLRRVTSSAAAWELDGRLERATQSHAALRAFDLDAARDALGAIVTRQGRPP
jgi:hypothetical protein